MPPVEECLTLPASKLWGIHSPAQRGGIGEFPLAAVEVKDVELPEGMKRSMAAQAEAERERRAKIIHAEGEFQASQTLAEAGSIISQNPTTLQLRYLQTLTEVASEKNSTLIFPLPIDLFTVFMQKMDSENKGK